MVILIIIALGVSMWRNSAQWNQRGFQLEASELVPRKKKIFPPKSSPSVGRIGRLTVFVIYPVCKILEK